MLSHLITLLLHPTYPMVPLHKQKHTLFHSSRSNVARNLEVLTVPDSLLLGAWEVVIVYLAAMLQQIASLARRN